MMIHTHAKFAPLDFINKKMEGKCRFFTQTEHPQSRMFSSVFSQKKNLGLSAIMECREDSCHNYGKPNSILSAVRCMYHKLALLECSYAIQVRKIDNIKIKCIPLSKIEQTRSPLDMSISEFKYITTFLDSDVSETISSSG